MLRRLEQSAEVAKGQELVSEQVQTASEAAALHPPVPVLYAPADQSVPDVGTQVGLVEDGLQTAGINSVVIPSACSCADEYWMEVKERQMSESVRRFRKQVLVREVCRRRLRLLVGAKQGCSRRASGGSRPPWPRFHGGHGG